MRVPARVLSVMAATLTGASACATRTGAAPAVVVRLAAVPSVELDQAESRIVVCLPTSPLTRDAAAHGAQVTLDGRPVASPVAAQRDCLQERVRTGDGDLVVSRPGYRAVRVRVRARPGFADTIVVRLSPAGRGP